MKVTMTNLRRFDQKLLQAVERAAASLCKRFNTDDKDPRVGFVKLTGLAHADERAAFKEMARQLCA